MGKGVKGSDASTRMLLNSVYYITPKGACQQFCRKRTLICSKKRQKVLAFWKNIWYNTDGKEEKSSWQQTNVLPVAQLDSASDSDSEGRRFESFRVGQKIQVGRLGFFYPLRKQWYIITRQRVSHHRRCISSAEGCIRFRNDDIQRQAVGDMQGLRLDDIHASGVIGNAGVQNPFAEERVELAPWRQACQSSRFA